jgi:DNA polymerase elongation subunit (family B)
VEQYLIQDEESFREMKAYLLEDRPNISVNGQIIKTDEYEFILDEQYSSFIPKIQKTSGEYSNDLIFGKDKTENVVSVEVVDEEVWLFLSDGEIITKPNYYWVLSNKPLDKKFKRLDGNQHYKFRRLFKDAHEFRKWTNIWKKQQKDIYYIHNEKEAAMVYYGITLFKGMKVQDLSVLSFDIEASGLVRDDSSEVFMISNTFRKNDKITKRVFREDHWDSIRDMLEAWCEFVQEHDPDILTGHNIFGYDLDYLAHVASIHNYELELGRNCSPIKFNKYSSKYRVDGTQSWEYKKVNVFGRHIVDTMFLSVKYDIGRNYPSWGLKPIIEHEGLVKEGRVFYDASKIREDWKDLEKREKIVQYGKDDSDDSLALFDLQVPSFFYMTQSIPKPFQLVINSASGSWLNSILVRSYLQNGKAVAKTDEPNYVAGGISFGIPGLHKNVFKIDIKSMYPSIIREFKIGDNKKDPDQNYLEMVNYFTEQRFSNKNKYKETGDKYYDDLQASQKIFINSCYGLMGTPGLNFNNFSKADEITGIARQIIKRTIEWSTGKELKHWWEDYDEEKDEKYERVLEALPNDYDFKLCNCDTDSISFSKRDGGEFPEEEQIQLLDRINSLLPEKIEYEDDGLFDRVLVLKAKNYCLLQNGKIKKKGSSITDSKKEPALTEFLDRMIDSLIYERDNLVEIYNEYIKEAVNITDILRWSVKKNITAAVLNPTRTNEQKVLDALEGMEVQEGDKYFMYSALDGMIQKKEKGELVFLN